MTREPRVRTGKRYTDQERARILDTMSREGLTLRGTSEKFGVSEVSIWKWRRYGRTPLRKGNGLRERESLDGALQSEVRLQVRKIIKREVDSLVRQMLRLKSLA